MKGQQHLATSCQLGRQAGRLKDRVRWSINDCCKQHTWVCTVPVQVLRRLEAGRLQALAQEQAQLHETRDKVGQAGLLEHVCPYDGRALQAKETVVSVLWKLNGSLLGVRNDVEIY